jgi:hypothetical protein
VNALTALAGLLLLGRHFRERLEGRLVLAWLALSVGLVAYGLVSQWAAARGVHLLNVVAVHHFWLYLKAAGAVGFGLAVATLLERALPRLPGAWPAALRHHASLVLALAAAVAAAAALPSLAAREDFRRARLESLRESGKTWREALVRFLRDHARPDEVLLADPDDALMVVGPSGRKTVCVLANFANPYVAWEPRAAATAAMFGALQRADGPGFLALASRYRVGFVLHRKSGPFGLDRHAMPFLAREAREGPFILYRVRWDAGRDP